MACIYPNPPQVTTWTIRQHKGCDLFEVGRIEAPTMQDAVAEAVIRWGDGIYYATQYRGEPVFTTGEVRYGGSRRANGRRW